MPALNLKSLDPAELMPLPEIPESYGPRNEEEQRIDDLVMEGINSGPGKQYASVAEFAAEFRAQRSACVSCQDCWASLRSAPTYQNLR
ncbi:hypothetical protein [Andreprevotia chitinilytica]|uniref:hypothetical protein n=1 Tax=Andreprevotia chitinilytica TaxID=396808 RepID=UPI000551E0BB|nr:hypothetical protein [Andreprevotia chitinilytica]